MKYDIYFHNDFDGRASAAVVLAFLEGRGDRIEHFVPIDHDLQPAWRDEQFFKKHKLFKGARNPAIVVDFPYHPEAAWWFDHHVDPFKRPDWGKKFKPSKTRAFDQDFASCCHFVYATLKKNFDWKPPRHLAELVHWADVIDGAQYKSPGQTLLLKEPALEVGAFIDETYHNKTLAKRMVQWFASEPFGEIAKIPEIKKVASTVRKKNKKALIFYKKNLKIIGNTTYIDLPKNPDAFLRFAPYFLYPKTRYAMRFGWKGKLYHIGIGHNPWLKGRNKLNIGLLLREYGGGGHWNAGAVDFASRADALRAIQELLKRLNAKK